MTSDMLQEQHKYYVSGMDLAHRTKNFTEMAKEGQNKAKSSSVAENTSLAHATSKLNMEVLKCPTRCYLLIKFVS